MTKFYNNKKNLVIIGSSGRIGRSLLINELEKGNNVVGIDLNQKINKTLQHKNYFFIKSDISRKKNLNKAFQTINKKFSNIDIVVNCSYPKSKQFGKNFEDLNEKYLKQDLYNQIGISILISQISIKFFLKQKYGNLILLSSIQGISAPKFEHYKNTNMVSPIEYSASKAGIISITKYLAKKYTAQFSEFTGAEMLIERSRDSGGKAGIMVETRLLMPGSAPIKVGWQVSDASGKFKMIDVKIEGVSLLTTERGKIRNQYSKEGRSISKLINSLLNY